MGGFPGGCGSNPFPFPLFPWIAPDWAIAGESIVVKRSTVIAGGTVTASFPAAERNARRLDSADVGLSCVIMSLLREMEETREVEALT